MEGLEVEIREPSGRLACPAGWTRTRENSLMLRDWEFWFVWRGHGRMYTAETDFVLSPGFCALMRPGGIYDADHDERRPLGIMFLHFDIRRTSEDPDAWPEFFDADEVGYVDLLARRILRLRTVARGVASALLAALVTDTLTWPSWNRSGAAARRITRHDSTMLEIATRLRDSEFGPNPTVSELAAEAHLGPAHFARVFQEVNGVSPRELVIQQRMERARHLLRESSLTVAQIAAELGYHDASYFTRQFTDRLGMPPTAFRARDTA